MHTLRPFPCVSLGQGSNAQLERPIWAVNVPEHQEAMCKKLFIPLPEREQLNRFPSDITEDDLIAYFTLSTVDKELLVDRRGDHNLLGFAVQLCTLRYLGYCPDELAHIPQHVIVYLGKQLAIKHTDVLIRQYGV